MSVVPEELPDPEDNLAAFLLRPGVIELRPHAVPEPGPGEVLVAIDAVGVCGSDVHYFEDGRIGDFVVTEPLVLGHEAAGRVVACGPGPTRHEAGTRVTIEPGIPCRSCSQCREGHYNLCPFVRFLATPPVHGAFTRYLVVPEDFCYPVPDSLSDDAAALLEPTSVAVAAVRRAGVSLADRVLVTGAGPVGILVAFTAHAVGATATVCDVDPVRLEKAAALGLTDVVNVAETPWSDLGGGFNCLIECSGALDVLRQSLPLLRPRGVAIAVGMSASDDLRLPLSVLQTRELVVTGTFRYANTYQAALELAVAGMVPLDAMVGATFSLSEVESALRCTRADTSVLKAVVHPQPVQRPTAATPHPTNGGHL